MEKQWYYMKDGSPEGPVFESELKEIVKSGVIGREIPVWTEGMTVWVSASSTKEFGLKSVPPPIPGTSTPPPIPQQGSSSPPPIPITSIPQTPPSVESKPESPSVQGNEKSYRFVTVFGIILLLIFLVSGVVYVVNNPELGLKGNIKKAEFSTALTKAQLENGEYYTQSYHEKFKLKNGVFERGMPGSMSDNYVHASIINLALGDINNDNIVDAAVVLGLSGGATGLFNELIAMVNRGGKPHQVASVALGDRVVINSITINRGEIVIDMTSHGPNDPMCCPTMKKVKRFRLVGDKLVRSKKRA
jgi:hypothetical protein